MVDLTKFGTMLDACESARGNVLNDWEQRFVADLRVKMNGRADQDDLGITMWTPTRNQYNTVHGIWCKL